MEVYKSYYGKEISLLTSYVTILGHYSSGLKLMAITVNIKI
jgi:hypothetical protein